MITPIHTKSTTPAPKARPERTIVHVTVELDADEVDAIELVQGKPFSNGAAAGFIRQATRNRLADLGVNADSLVQEVSKPAEASKAVLRLGPGGDYSRDVTDVEIRAMNPITWLAFIAAGAAALALFAWLMTRN